MLITGTALLIIWLVRNYYLSHTYERQYQSMREKISLLILVSGIINGFSILSSVLMVIFSNDTTANEKEINESLDLLYKKTIYHIFQLLQLLF